MKRTVLCGILITTMLVGCSSNVENTQNIQLQNAVSERQMEAAEIAPEQEAPKTDISVKAQENADSEQDAAIANARNKAAAIAEAEVATWMQMGLENVDVAATKIEKEKEAREVAKAEEEKEAQAATKAEKEKKEKAVVQDAVTPAQTVQNEAAVVEISRIYIEDCGSDSGYWEITYSDGHIEYIDD